MCVYTREGEQVQNQCFMSRVCREERGRDRYTGTESVLFRRWIYTSIEAQRTYTYKYALSATKTSQKMRWVGDDEKEGECFLFLYQLNLFLSHTTIFLAHSIHFAFVLRTTSNGHHPKHLPSNATKGRAKGREEYKMKEESPLDGPSLPSLSLTLKPITVPSYSIKMCVRLKVRKIVFFSLSS